MTGSILVITLFFPLVVHMRQLSIGVCGSTLCFVNYCIVFPCMNVLQFLFLLFFSHLFIFARAVSSLLCMGYCLVEVYGLLISLASLSAACSLQSWRSAVVVRGLRCSLSVESSWSRDQIHVPCTDSRLLIHCSIRKSYTMVSDHSFRMV